MSNPLVLVIAALFLTTAVVNTLGPERNLSEAAAGYAVGAFLIGTCGFADTRGIRTNFATGSLRIETRSRPEGHSTTGCSSLSRLRSLSLNSQSPRS